MLHIFFIYLLHICLLTICWTLDVLVNQTSTENTSGPDRLLRKSHNQTDNQCINAIMINWSSAVTQLPRKIAKGLTRRKIFRGGGIRLKQENDEHTESEEERDVLTGRQKHGLA